jgi:hypothetical protein
LGRLEVQVRGRLRTDVRGAIHVLDYAMGVEAAASMRAVAAGLQHSHTQIPVATARGLWAYVAFGAVGEIEPAVGVGLGAIFRCEKTGSYNLVEERGYQQFETKVTS